MDGNVFVQERNFDLERKGALAAKVIWLAMAVLFIFPLYKMSFIFEEYTITGFGATFGAKAYGETIFMGSFLFGVLLYIPVIELIANFMLSNINDVVKWNLIGSLIETVMILIYIIGLPLAYKSDFVDVSVEVLPAFYIMLIISISSIVLSIYMMNNIITPKKVDITEEDMCRKGGNFIIVYCISFVLILLIMVNFKAIITTLWSLIIYGRIFI